MTPGLNAGADDRHRLGRFFDNKREETADTAAVRASVM
jgi:hypothetical protein